MIQLDNIKKVFQTEEVETWALRNISLQVKEGEFVAIMGPSGCGKSTLLNIIGLLNNPTSGSYLLDGKDVSKLKENIELPLLYMGVSGKERRKRAEDVMERVAISHRAKHFPSQLSGGQQQRTAIARAILPHPKLILADEPTGNLDSKNGKEVMELLSELHKEGTTIVMVTHSLHDANYADRIINMFDGEIVNQVEM